MIKHFIVILIGLNFLFSGCQQTEGNNLIQTKDESPYCIDPDLKKTISISDLYEQDIHDQISLTGKVSYDENDLVAFKSLIQGVVTKVNFEVGDFVEKGKVLAVVKSAEINDLAKERRLQQNQVELLKKQIKTKQELMHDGLASQPEVAELEFQLSAAQLEVEKISNALNIYRSIDKEQFQILAPKDGYIVQKSISAGQTISTDAEASLFSISNLKKVWVMINVYANNLKFIHIGDEVKVRTVAYPDRIYQGKIDKIYNVFDDNEHVTKARVVLENVDLNLMPGLSADIIINKQNILGKAYAVPKNALVFANNRNYVVLYKGDCAVEVRKVTPISSNEEFVYVEEKFEEKEQVISSNALIIFEEIKK